MLAAAASAWEAFPTELDELWCPTIEFVGGAAESSLSLLIEGGSQPSKPAFSGERHYLLHFSGVEAVSGYAESLYCIYVRPSEPGDQPLRSVIRRAGHSDLAQSAGEVRSRGTLFAVLGGGMQCEILAHPAFELERFETHEAALAAAFAKRRRHSANLEASEPDARALLDSLKRRVRQ